jgi:RNA polymerase primary sigma factor
MIEPNFEDQTISVTPAGVSLEEEPELYAEPKETQPSPVLELDADRLFFAELAETTVLPRAEEIALARRIVRARKRVRAILRRARRLSLAALADNGRGVVPPDQDFREREALSILSYAQDALQDRRKAVATGLKRKELRAFLAELSSALEEYRTVRDQMVRANLRLVSMLARRYRHPTLTFLDLFQEGTIGLFRAVEKYEPGRNVKFSTYAAWWIWQQLGRAADTQGALIRTPVHWSQFRRRLNRETQEAARETDGVVSRAQLASAAGMDRVRLDTMAQSFHFVSTDAPLGDDDDRPLESMLPSTGNEPEEHAGQNSLRRHLEHALRRLPERESMILRQRFGLENDESQTLDEIGTRLGVSRERVRQLESRALKQLKEVCADQGLRDYLN